MKIKFMSHIMSRHHISYMCGGGTIKNNHYENSSAIKHRSNKYVLLPFEQKINIVKYCLSDTRKLKTSAAHTDILELPFNI